MNLEHHKKIIEIVNPQKQKLIIYILLAVMTLAVYWQVNHFEFVNIDDNLYVTQNIHIQSGITPEAIKWAFCTKYADLWHPLIWISFLLDYQFYGLNAGGYHLTNLILHILSTLLLFWLFNRMTGALWKSAFVAAFFSLHPLHVESVAWVSERKDVLSAFFWMLTLCLYVYYVEKPAVRRYLLVVFSFILALMSKPMVVTLPVIMILLDYWPLKRFESRKDNLFLWQLKEKLPFLVLSVVFSIMTIFSHINRPIEYFPWSSRLANALVAFATYLEKTFLPLNLAVYYPFPAQIPLWQILGTAFLIIVISVVVFMFIKRLPYLFVGWMWFVITILPVLGILQDSDQAMADRYHYLPSIGLAVMLAWITPLLLPNENARKRILFPLSIAFLAVMSFLTWQQCGYWKNSVDLAKHTLQVTKDNSVAHNCLALALVAEGKSEEAVYHYNEASRIKPGNVLIYINRGEAYYKLGRYQNALEDLNKSILMKPDNADAYNGRAIIYNKLGMNQQALKDFSKAIQLKPDNPSIYFNRGNAYINLAQYQNAIDDYSFAISLKPDYFDAYNNRGFIYLKLNRYAKALEDYSKAIDLKPDYADPWNNRAFIYLVTGNINSGCKDAEKACAEGVCAALEAAKAHGSCH